MPIRAKHVIIAGMDFRQILSKSEAPQSMTDLRFKPSGANPRVISMLELG
jgi:hypothetical protein